MDNESQYKLIKQAVKDAAKNGVKLSSQTVGDILEDNGAVINGSTKGSRNRGVSQKIGAAYKRSDANGKQEFYDVIQ